jgi:hypothetical protein
MLSIGSHRCQCSGCGRYFGGVSAFDAHQTLGNDGRPVCHDPASLTNKKGESLGYVVDKLGYWGRPMPEGIVWSVRKGKLRTKEAA